MSDSKRQREIREELVTEREELGVDVDADEGELSMNPLVYFMPLPWWQKIITLACITVSMFLVSPVLWLLWVIFT